MHQVILNLFQDLYYLLLKQTFPVHTQDTSATEATRRIKTYRSNEWENLAAPSRNRKSELDFLPKGEKRLLLPFVLKGSKKQLARHG